MTPRVALLLLAVVVGSVAVARAQDPTDFGDDFGDDDEAAAFDFGAADEVDSAEAADDGEKPPPEPLEFKTPLPEGKYHFADPFVDQSGLGKKWIVSQSKKDDGASDIAQYNGEWEIAEPENKVLTNDFGLLVKNKARHHAVSSKLHKQFDFTASRDFVMQYEVKYQNGQECGGGYVKLLTATPQLDLKTFNDKTGYTIMFGPDKCGLTAKLHFIVRYKNPISGEIKEHHAKQPEGVALDSYFNDHKSHLYTLIIKDDNSFVVKVDQTRVAGGDLSTDLEPPITPPKQIEDPEDKKPEDWDEREKIPDETATKPDDWDEDAPAELPDEAATMPSGWLEAEPELVDDPEASKPEDWDPEMDGEWEAAKIPNPACASAPGCGEWKRPLKANPAYKGKWKAPLIANPNYKGKWSPRIIDNPAYFDAEPYKMAPIGAIGIELWTMSDQILFDNFLITDSETVASKFADKTWKLKHEQEELFAKSTSSKKPPYPDMDEYYPKPDKKKKKKTKKKLNTKTENGPVGAVAGVFQSLLDAANEKPWLWAVYLLTVLIPIILIAIFCTGGTKQESEETKYARVKKTDEPQPDDDDEEEEEEEKPKSTGSPKKSTSGSQSGTPRRSGRVAAKATSKDDLEDDESESEEVDDDEDEEVEAEPKPKASPGRRARARKD